MIRFLVVLFVAFAPTFSSAFVAPQVRAVSGPTSTSLNVGPLKKLTNRNEYDKVVEGIMVQKGLTREEAEKDYNSFLDNPNDYALNKGEAYYKSLGYKTVMEGVIGEAEKEGRGDEVRERIDEFKKQSKLKGLATMAFFITAFFYYKSTYVPPIPPHY